MTRGSAVLVATFAVLAVTAVLLAGVAARERRVESVASASAVIPAGQVFDGLTGCEIPGLRERLLSRRKGTRLYAGEFSPTSTPAWTTGSSRISLYVLSGTGVVRVGGASWPARAGDFFVIPKAARHAVGATNGVLRAIYFEES